MEWLCGMTCPVQFEIGIKQSKNQVSTYLVAKICEAVPGSLKLAIHYFQEGLAKIMKDRYVIEKIRQLFKLPKL